MISLFNFLGCVGAALQGAAGIPYVLYLLMIVYAGMFIYYSIKNNKSKLVLCSIDLLVISMIIPDNYSIIAISLIVAIVLKFKINSIGLRSIQLSDRIILIGVFIYIIFNTIINLVNPVNALFFIVYYIPLLLFYYIFKIIDINEAIYRHILKRLKEILVFELIAILCYAVSHLGVIFNANDMDWVVGTLGAYQCNVLMCICSFIGLIFINDYILKKDKRSVIWIIISFAIAMSTSSLTYTMVLFAAFIMVFITNVKIKLKVRMIFAVLIIGGGGIFYAVSPAWITQEIPRMFDSNYAEDRIVKINAYEDVFKNLPRNEGWDKFWIGCGAGSYSSRAAQTCMGTYIDGYNEIFDPHISEYTRKYIMNYNAIYRGEGLSGRPDSSIVSIQGEFGVIGLMLLLIILVCMYKRSKNIFARILILFFVGMMFFDNSLEFAKYGLAFYLGLNVIEKHITAV